MGIERNLEIILVLTDKHFLNFKKAATIICILQCIMYEYNMMLSSPVQDVMSITDK